MIKVLDLFAGTQSVKKGLEIKYKIEKGLLNGVIGSGFNSKYKEIIQYIGIDLVSPEGKNLIFDMSKDNIVTKLILELKGWKPDFIWGSPVCNKFSMAAPGKGGNAYFIVENNTIRLRSIDEYVDVKLNNMNKKTDEWKEYYNGAKNALKIHNNTKKIIKHFNTNFVIENPKTALTKYIYVDYVKNFTTYCMYGFDYKKQTTIYSNININLLSCNHHTHYTTLTSVKGKKWLYPRHGKKTNNTYTNRASVPPKLIVDILEKIGLKNVE